MKVAFHFDETKLGIAGKAIEPLLTFVRRRNLLIRSRLFVGTLLIRTGAAKCTRHANTTVERIDRRTLQALIREWVSPQPFNWFALLPGARKVVRAGSVYCVQFETIQPNSALALHTLARQAMSDVYLGALQVDESLASHLAGYQLLPWARLDGDRAFVNWDGIDEDGKMPWLIDTLRGCGFGPVAYEIVEAKFTIFDRHSGADAAHRTARSRAALIELLDSVVDAALIRIQDAMPDVRERMWSIIDGYRTAEVDEQYSEVALGCRRLIEYAADCLSPPVATEDGARKLDKAAFKNRLLRYLEENQVSKEDCALIKANVSAIAAELDRLLTLVQKGVHASSKPEQARRCLLRTVLLLDDLCAVSRENFAVRVSLDEGLIERIATGHPSR